MSQTVKTQRLTMSATLKVQETRGAGGTVVQGPTVTTASAPLDNTADNLSVPFSYTILSGANTTIDFRALTNAFGTALVFGKIRGLLISVAGSALKIEPGASNDLAWFLRGTAPELHLDAGGAVGLFWAAQYTVDGTHKTLKLTNTGGATATVTVIAFGGT